MTQVDVLKSKMLQFQYSPPDIVDTVVDMITEIHNGEIELVDASNPFVLAVESSAVMASATLSKLQSIHRKQFPVMSVNREELYRHMTARDYVNAYAAPSSGIILLFINKANLIGRMVNFGDDGVRKVTIPRNTTVTVSGYDFGMHYPIDIFQMRHGGLRVMVNTDVAGVDPATTNNVVWNQTNVGGVDYIVLELPMTQFKITTKLVRFDEVQEFKLKLDLTDQFWRARVMMQVGETWQDINVTHDSVVYDPNTVTAVITVLDSQVVVRIPQVYLNSGLAARNFRVDIYETKGPMRLDLSEFALGAYSAVWRTIATNEENAYVAAMRAVTDVFFLSDQVIEGGRSALTFEELRARLLSQSLGDNQLPITQAEMDAVISDSGYTIMRSVDTVTERDFKATRPLSAPTSTEIISPVNVGNYLLTTSEQELLSLANVVQNESSITILPSTMYKRLNDKLLLVAQEEIDAVKALPPEDRVAEVNNQRYLYSPFFYVLDFLNEEFAVRVYDLADPKIANRTFLGDNDSSGYTLSTSDLSIQVTPNGIRLTLATDGDDAIKGLADSMIGAQISFRPQGETQIAYALATQVYRDPSDNFRFVFDINTNYFINENNQIELTNFALIDENPMTVRALLKQEFIVHYYTLQALPGYQRSTMDYELSDNLLPSSAVAIVKEMIPVSFGQRLEHLWSRTRSSAAAAEFEKWDMDIPLTYTRDVYTRDPLTGAQFSIVNGEIVYNIAFHAGDQVVDSGGQPVWLHRIGDVKHGPDGEPIIKNARSIKRQIEMILFDGAMQFVTDPGGIAYRDDLKAELVRYAVDDMAKFQGRLLDNTNIYFQPVATHGAVNVMMLDGQAISIESQQSLTLTVHMTGAGYDDADARTQLQNKFVQTISDYFKNKVISVSELQHQLILGHEDQVIDIHLEGLGGDLGIEALTVLDQDRNLGLRKILRVNTAGQCYLAEDVTVLFIRHALE